MEFFSGQDVSMERVAICVVTTRASADADGGRDRSGRDRGGSQGVPAAAAARQS